ncbi:unnamed protein product [Candidula unifasciata]|uniref:Transmembrane protein 179 n=1 Tax=Candidula unifasciata TaxID=100452 RepID=A0A8S3YVI3_9EUPU|nr:unnamed protein product [Candidula unifasciata]
MGLHNLFLFAQCCFYLLLFIMSFFACIPAGVNVSNFNGHCLLYARGEWTKEATTSNLDHIDWGPDSACNFTVFIGVVSLIIALFYLVWISVMLARSIECSWLEAFVNSVVNSVMCICFFSTALTVSVGFRQWCKFVTDPRSGIERCEQGQYIPFGLSVSVDTSNYFIQWQITQFGVWAGWILWLVLAIMSLIRVYNYHRQEAFMISVNRERQRLLAKVGHPADPV